MERHVEEENQTWHDRVLRLRSMLKNIQENKKMLRDDAVKFGMRRWMMSRRIVETYVKELIEQDKIKIVNEGGTEYVVPVD